MPKKKRTQRAVQSQVTKQLLYESATRQFKEKGFENVTIEDICFPVGVTVGAFYYHFKCKEDLIYIWAAERDKQHKEYYVAQLLDPDHGDAVELLRNLILCTLEIYSSWGWEFAAVSFSYMMKNPIVNKEIVEMHHEYYKILGTLVRQGLRDGLLRNDLTEEQIIKGVVRFSRNCVIDWCINGGKADIRQDNLPFLCAFIDGIKTQPTK